jgi:hypothetical protein
MFPAIGAPNLVLGAHLEQIVGPPGVAPALFVGVLSPKAPAMASSIELPSRFFPPPPAPPAVYYGMCEAVAAGAGANGVHIPSAGVPAKVLGEAKFLYGSGTVQVSGHNAVRASDLATSCMLGLPILLGVETSLPVLWAPDILIGGPTALDTGALVDAAVDFGAEVLGGVLKALGRDTPVLGCALSILKSIVKDAADGEVTPDSLVADIRDGLAGYAEGRLKDDINEAFASNGSASNGSPSSVSASNYSDVRSLASTAGER